MKVKRISFWIFLVLLVLLLANLNRIGRLFYPVKYEACIKENAAAYAIDPYLVMGMIKAESNFDEDAVSVKNATGLMQIMEPTALWLADRMQLADFEYQDITKPEINIKMGCYYISYLIEQYEGNIENALAAYNAGGGNVNRWLRDSSCSKDGKALDAIPFPETKRYVNRVLNNMRMYTLLYQQA